MSAVSKGQDKDPSPSPSSVGTEPNHSVLASILEGFEELDDGEDDVDSQNVAVHTTSDDGSSRSNETRSGASTEAPRDSSRGREREAERDTEREKARESQGGRGRETERDRERARERERDLVKGSTKSEPHRGSGGSSTTTGSSSNGTASSISSSSRDNNGRKSEVEVSSGGGAPQERVISPSVSSRINSALSSFSRTSNSPSSSSRNSSLSSSSRLSTSPSRLAPSTSPLLSSRAHVPFKTTRYFVMKTFTPKHLEISVEKSIWATQPHNEVKLNEAFLNSEVILIFSVNNSRHFQGYARMTSKIGRGQASGVWTSESGSTWGGSFQVEWISLYDLPFEQTLHIRNPLNINKPVKISRDGQELSAEAGAELCVLLNNGSSPSKRKRITSSETDQDLKKQKKEETSPETDSREGLPRERDHRTTSRHSTSRITSHHHGSRDRSISPAQYARSARAQDNHNDSRRRRSASPTSGKEQPLGLNLLNMTYEDYLAALGEKYRYSWTPHSQSHVHPSISNMPVGYYNPYSSHMHWESVSKNHGHGHSYGHASRRRD